MKQLIETQNQPAKRSPLAMKCTVNRAALKPNSGTSVYVAVDLTPSAAAVAGRVRSISLAIDSSGSMDGEKIEQAKAAALGLIKQLRPDDQLAIVSFSDAVTIQLPMSRVGNSRQVAAAVKALSVGGLTAMYDGLDAAFRQAREASKVPGAVHRVILLTDGNPTVGRTDGKDFVTLAQGIREGGITITAIGIGTDYNDSLLQKIAESGGGLWHHIKDGQGDLPQIFQAQAEQMAGTIVAHPELKVSIMPGSELADAYSVKPVLNRLPRPKFDGQAVHNRGSSVNVTSTLCATSTRENLSSAAFPAGLAGTPMRNTSVCSSPAIRSRRGTVNAWPSNFGRGSRFRTGLTL